MSDTLSNKKEIERLLEESPQLQQFNNRLHVIAELINDAKAEKDLSLMADSFDTVIRLQDRVSAEMISYISKSHIEVFNGMEKNCREWKEIAEKLEAALNEERQANRQTFDNLCAAFVINPRAAFEMVLKFIERDEKCKCPDGNNNRQWTLRFPFMARLRIAVKLMFGCRTMSEDF